MNLESDLNHKLSIICADDMYLNLEALRVILNSLGLADFCKFVENGKELADSCIDETKSLEPNTELMQIIITDYEMPMKTGIEAIKEIRAFYNI